LKKDNLSEYLLVFPF